MGECQGALAHGAECSPECNDGYELTHTARCHLGTLRPPRCTPRSCDVDQSPMNGSNGDCPVRLRHGEACQPACDEGYELDDVTRCEFGTLVESRCTPKGCAPVTPPLNGSSGACPDSLEDGESCKPECSPGYVRHGETECKHGTLSVAACKPAGCVASAFLSEKSRGNCPETMQHGESCQPMCADPRDEPTGLSVCEHGTLKIAACKPRSCIVAAMPPGASPGDCGETLADGASCSPQCPSGHALTSTMRCDKGTLQVPECRPQACAVRRLPAHGRMGTCRATLEHGGTCQPDCDDGYEPLGHATCAYGELRGDFRCTPKSCARPEPPVNGSEGACTTDLHDGESCTPSCDDGYELVEPTSCHKGDVSIGACRPQSCVVSPPENGAMGNCDTVLDHGRACQFDCDDGYRATGDTTCAFGRVRPSTCVPQSCSVPTDDPAHSDCPTELVHGQSCALACPPGHVASSDTRCAFGSLSVGQCLPSDCETPQSIPNGCLGTCGATLAHGQTCIPECDEGYTLSEPMSCAYGRMSRPRCTPNRCVVTDPENATSSGDCPPTLEHGATCQPECKDGHTLVGVTACSCGRLEVAQCIADRCTLAVEPEHGAFGNCPSTLESGQSCAIQCDSGYRPVGVTKCNAGVLTMASCEPTECEMMPSIEHGRLGTCPSDRPLVHGEFCQPKCDDGYHLSGSTFCSVGTLKVGKCLPSPCNNVRPPDNGGLGDCTDKLESGAMCTPECKEGYTLSGPMVCSLGQVTTPRCLPDKCQMAAPEHGSLGDCPDTLDHGEQCEPQCDDGYVPSKASCRAGRLTAPRCTPKSCDVVAPNHGTMGDCTAVLAHSKSCTPECAPGYTLSGPTSCHTGTLTRSTCVPKSCTGLTAPAHGRPGSCPCTLEHGRSCMVECDAGYTPSGPTNCNLGELTESRCVPNSCTIVPPANATMGTCTATLQSGEVCLPQCNAGFTLQAPTKCHTGQVSPSVCAPDSCRVAIPDHGAPGDCATTLESGGTCHPTCDEGYRLKNPTTCLNGALAASVCEPKSCAVPIPVNGDKGDCAESIAHGAECRPTCRDGYVLSNPTRCDKGVLTATSSCVPKSCRVDIGAIPNAVPGNCPTIIQDGESCKPLCLDRYDIHGEVRCDKGRIVGPFAECRPSSCANPTVPEHGSKGAGWKDPLPSGESNLVTCADGYTATNQGKVTCDKGRLGDPVVCKPASCANPPVPEHGSKGAGWKDPLPSGDSNRVTCADGYTATNQGKVTCDKGRLGDPVVCRPASCEKIAVPANGVKVQPWHEPLEPGEFNLFKCDIGFTPTNDGKIACQNGQPTPAECKKDPLDPLLIHPVITGLDGRTELFRHSHLTKDEALSMRNLDWSNHPRLRDQGYIAKYRSSAIPDDAAYVASDVEGNFIHWNGKDTWGMESVYGNGGPGVQGHPDRQLDYIRWGFTRTVKPSKLFFSTGSYGEHNNNAKVSLSGCNSAAFDDCELLFSGALDDQNHAKGYAFNKPTNSVNGWKFFELKNTSSESQCGLCCQKFQVGLQQ